MTMIQNSEAETDPTGLQRLAELTKYVSGGGMTEAGIKRAEAEAGARVQMNEWANSVDGRRDDRGQIFDQPTGGPVQPSLMQYLGAQPKKVQVAENAGSVLESFRTKGKAAPAAPAAKAPNTRAAAIGGDRRTRLLEASKASGAAADLLSQPVMEGSDKKKKADKKANKEWIWYKGPGAVVDKMEKALKAEFKKMEDGDSEISKKCGLNTNSFHRLEAALSPDSSPNLKMPTGTYHIFSVSHDDGASEAKKVITKLSKALTSYSIRIMKTSVSENVVAVIQPKGKSDVKESADGARESAYRQRIRAEMNETRNMRSRPGIKAQAKAELRESANGRPALSERVAARKRRMILESTDPEFAASSLSAADSREEAGRSIMEGRGLPKARTWSGRKDVSEGEDRSDYFRSGGPEAGASRLNEEAVPLSRSAIKKVIEDWFRDEGCGVRFIHENSESDAVDNGRNYIHVKITSTDHSHEQLENEMSTCLWTRMNKDIGRIDWSTLENNSYSGSADRDRENECVIKISIAQGLAESGDGSFKTGILEGAVKRAWLDGAKFIANGGATSWVMTEVAQRDSDGKYIVREGEDPSIDRNSGGLLPLGHVHAVYETRKEADAYCAALMEKSKV